MRVEFLSILLLRNYLCLVDMHLPTHSQFLEYFDFDSVVDWSDKCPPNIVSTSKYHPTMGYAWLDPRSAPKLPLQGQMHKFFLSQSIKYFGKKKRSLRVKFHPPQVTSCMTPFSSEKRKGYGKKFVEIRHT